MSPTTNHQPLPHLQDQYAKLKATIQAQADTFKKSAKKEIEDVIKRDPLVKSIREIIQSLKAYELKCSGVLAELERVSREHDNFMTSNFQYRSDDASREIARLAAQMTTDLAKKSLAFMTREKRLEREIITNAKKFFKTFPEQIDNFLKLINSLPDMENADKKFLESIKTFNDLIKSYPINTLKINNHNSVQNLQMSLGNDVLIFHKACPVKYLRFENILEEYIQTRTTRLSETINAKNEKALLETKQTLIKALIDRRITHLQSQAPLPSDSLGLSLSQTSKSFLNYIFIKEQIAASEARLNSNYINAGLAINGQDSIVFKKITETLKNANITQIPTAEDRQIIKEILEPSENSRHKITPEVSLSTFDTLNKLYRDLRFTSPESQILQNAQTINEIKSELAHQEVLAELLATARSELKSIPPVELKTTSDNLNLPLPPELCPSAQRIDLRKEKVDPQQALHFLKNIRKSQIKELLPEKLFKNSSFVSALVQAHDFDQLVKLITIAEEKRQLLDSNKSLSQELLNGLDVIYLDQTKLESYIKKLAIHQEMFTLLSDLKVSINQSSQVADKGFYPLELLQVIKYGFFFKGTFHVTPSLLASNYIRSNISNKLATSVDSKNLDRLLGFLHKHGAIIKAPRGDRYGLNLGNPLNNSKVSQALVNLAKWIVNNPDQQETKFKFEDEMV